MEKVSVLIISGSVGVGKTSTAESISDILRDRSISHAFVDIDNLAHVYPKPKDDPFYYNLAMTNLASVWKNLEKEGVTHLILPYVFEQRNQIKDFEKAIPDSKIKIVGLRAKIETIHERLRKRERAKTLKWHLNRAAVLTKQFEENKVEDFVIDTDNKTVEEIAKEIVEKTGFLGDE